MAQRPGPWLVLLVLAASACGDRADDGARPAPSSIASGDAVAPAGSGSTAAASSAAASGAAAASSNAPDAGSTEPASFPGTSEGCPSDMVRVQGDYCPAVMQHCLEHHKEYETDKDNRKVSERCLKYEQPSRCVSKERKNISFCMDRFEWPGVAGEMPRVLTSWTQAKQMCKDKGKRLCTEDEFNFACEGPDILPYVYGFVRDTKAETCNVDRDYRTPSHEKRMLYYEDCWKDERCNAEMTRLDQREPIGQRTTCVSWSGVFDLNGNVNEWVEIPNEKPPNRSGLKGGWWGPIRSRCRPTVTFHKESDYGYEVGFRCCADPAAGGGAPPRSPLP